jgi:hypothetical protein
MEQQFLLGDSPSCKLINFSLLEKDEDMKLTRRKAPLHGLRYVTSLREQCRAISRSWATNHYWAIGWNSCVFSGLRR